MMEMEKPGGLKDRTGETGELNDRKEDASNLGGRTEREICKMEETKKIQQKIGKRMWKELEGLKKNSTYPPLHPTGYIGRNQTDGSFLTATISMIGVAQ